MTSHGQTSSLHSASSTPFYMKKSRPQVLIVTDVFNYTKSPHEVKVSTDCKISDQILNFINSILGKNVDMVISTASWGYNRVKYPFNDEQTIQIRNFAVTLLGEEEVGVRSGKNIFR